MNTQNFNDPAYIEHMWNPMFRKCEQHIRKMLKEHKNKEQMFESTKTLIKTKMNINLPKKMFKEFVESITHEDDDEDDEE